MGFDLKIRHRLGALTLDIAIAAPGDGVTALFGPSGAGKTSVARVVAGLMRPDAGRLALDGAVLADRAARLWTPPQKRRIGMVFQDGRLFDHLDVAGNLAFSQRYTGAVPAARRDELIALMGLAPLLARRPATLSGGERQRVALARALLSNPRMLVMDEPLAALDAPRKAEILPYLDRLKAEAGIPILYITHSVEELARLADHVVLMQDGQVLCSGAVFDVLSDPAAIPLMGVSEAGAILAAHALGPGPGGLWRVDVPGAGVLELPGLPEGTDVGAPLRLRILARDVILARTRPEGLSARNILPATIDGIEPGRGPGTAVVLRLGAQRLLARITEQSRQEMGLEPGDAVFVILKSSAVTRAAISR